MGDIRVKHRRYRSKKETDFVDLHVKHPVLHEIFRGKFGDSNFAL